jgi:hypothetical protein
MYGSYGSYSSMSSLSAPMDITSSNLRAHEATCAFPSWPRRSSLSDSSREQRPTSFLSDDDLLFLSDPFEDDAHSVTSNGSSAASLAAIESPQPTSAPRVTDAEILDMERERLAMQREYVRHMVSEKERRRQQQALKRQQLRRSSPSSGSKKKSKLGAITE